MYPYYQRQEVVRVNGMQSAQNYQMPPNSSALLIDNCNPIVYLCITDGAGMKTVKAYTITEYKPEDSGEYKALADRIAKLEEALIHEPNVKPAEQRKREFNDIIESVENWKP